MVPPSSSTATSTARRAVPSVRPNHEANRRRPPLSVVPPRRGRSLARRALRYLPAAVVVSSLLAVVVGQALLANGQVAMTGVNQQVAQAQTAHRTDELRVAMLETPSLIVGAATKGGMVHPSVITQLPYVPLSTPIATPKVTPAASTPTSSTATTASTAAPGQ
jgi:hypothetical protein